MKLATKQKDAIIQLRVPKEEKDRYTKEAKERRMSVSAWIRMQCLGDGVSLTCIEHPKTKLNVGRPPNLSKASLEVMEIKVRKKLRLPFNPQPKLKHRSKS